MGRGRQRKHDAACPTNSDAKHSNHHVSLAVAINITYSWRSDNRWRPVATNAGASWRAGAG